MLNEYISRFISKNLYTVYPVMRKNPDIRYSNNLIKAKKLTQIRICNKCRSTDRFTPLTCLKPFPI